MPRRNQGQMQAWSVRWFRKDLVYLCPQSNGSQAVDSDMCWRPSLLLRVLTERMTVLRRLCRRALRRDSPGRRENSIKGEWTQGPALNRICFHLTMLCGGESLLLHRLRQEDGWVSFFLRFSR